MNTPTCRWKRILGTCKPANRAHTFIMRHMPTQRRTETCVGHINSYLKEYKGMPEMHEGQILLGRTVQHVHPKQHINGQQQSESQRDTPPSFGSLPLGNHTLTPPPWLFFHTLPRFFSFPLAFCSLFYSRVHSVMFNYFNRRAAT